MNLNCEETYKRMQDYLDRELSPREMALVKDHLDSCGICSEEFEFELRVLRKIGRTLSDTEIPSDLVERVFASLGSS
ncbi:MAG: zf-HC2 domain-containing protein [Fimbriimonas sp.]|nr:zf-HC2 domain-containing protein [Fimbriimonas sp.]